MLGQYRPFFGIEIGRNGPPGADYYALPALMPLGNLLKASYLQEGRSEDLQVVREAIDRQNGRYNSTRLIEYGEQKLYQDLFVHNGSESTRTPALFQSTVSAAPEGEVTPTP
jgi:hypothetical protein